MCGHCLLFYSLARTFLVKFFINAERIGRNLNRELSSVLALLALAVTCTDRKHFLSLSRATAPWLDVASETNLARQ